MSLDSPPSLLSNFVLLLFPGSITQGAFPSWVNNFSHGKNHSRGIAARRSFEISFSRGLNQEFEAVIICVTSTQTRKVLIKIIKSGGKCAFSFLPQRLLLFRPCNSFTFWRIWSLILETMPRPSLAMCLTWTGFLEFISIPGWHLDSLKVCSHFYPFWNGFARPKSVKRVTKCALITAKRITRYMALTFLGLSEGGEKRVFLSWIVSRLTQISRGFEKSKTNVQRKRHR